VESFRAELELFTTTSHISLKDRWDHFLARWGIRRNQHRVKPGLYRLGDPGPRASVFVTANYTLSFDALRSALNGIDAYILVLDTHGINVWCAAAKGTFSTQELVGRIESTHLREIVKGRVLILPQLGAAGVSAHEVKRLSHFKVEYGPVRASDLAQYLETHQASAEMRRVKFDLWDRLVLVPVEVVHTFLPMLAAAIILWFLVGPLASIASITAVLAGVVLFPVLLPWLPTRNFSTQGLILGGIISLPFALVNLFSHTSPIGWQKAGWSLFYLAIIPPVAGYLALNFTGSTPHTSKSGVQREMSHYLPVMIGLFGFGVILLAVLKVVGLLS
jgi:hypothetical protein